MDVEKNETAAIGTTLRLVGGLTLVLVFLFLLSADHLPLLLMD